MDKNEKYIYDYLFFQEGPGVRNYQYTTSGVKLLNVSNLVDGNLDLSNSSRYISNEEAYGKYKHFLCDVGDLIIASSGIKADYFDKKIGFVKKEMLPLCMNTSTIRFKPLNESDMNIKYFMYYLKSGHFRKQLEYNLTGSAQLNFGPSHLKKMKFIYHDILKQKEIVRKLDSISNMIKLKKEQLLKLDMLIKSQFVEMFGNIKNNENFDYITIGDVIDKNIIKLKKNFKTGEEIKYIDISSIDNAKNIMTGYTKYFVGEEPSRAQQCLKYNDIVVSTVRPNLKNVAINKYTYENIIGTSGFCVLRCNTCRVEYLMYILLSDDFTKDMCSITTGANYPAIHNEDIYNYKIPNAPIELQNKFAQIVEQIDKQKFVNEKYCI